MRGLDDFRLIAERGRIDGGEVGGVRPDDLGMVRKPILELERGTKSSSLKLTRRLPRSGRESISPPDLVLSLIALAFPSMMFLIRSADSNALSAPYSSGLSWFMTSKWTERARLIEEVLILVVCAAGKGIGVGWMS